MHLFVEESAEGVHEFRHIFDHKHGTTWNEWAFSAFGAV